MLFFCSVPDDDRSETWKLTSRLGLTRSNQVINDDRQHFLSSSSSFVHHSVMIRHSGRSRSFRAEHVQLFTELNLFQSLICIVSALLIFCCSIQRDVQLDPLVRPRPTIVSGFFTFYSSTCNKTCAHTFHTPSCSFLQNQRLLFYLDFN